MWILAFHQLETKDYNKISRLFKSHEVWTVKYSSMLLAKALTEYSCQRTSWRKISNKYNITHSSIYQIYNKSCFTSMIYEVLDYFVEREIIYFVNSKTWTFERYNESRKNESKKALHSFWREKSI